MACVVLKPGEVLERKSFDGLLPAYSIARFQAHAELRSWTPRLPKSGSGKILKRILRDRYRARQERAVNWSPFYWRCRAVLVSDSQGDANASDIYERQDSSGTTQHLKHSCRRSRGKP